MNTAMLIEIFGYIGSALVVISMLMSSVVKLRIINTVGSVISGIYALISGALPLVLMNACLIIINVYNLFKLLKTKQEYDLVKGKAGDGTLNYFLEHYKDDIKVYFPNFKYNESLINTVYVIFCNASPAGVLLGKDKGNGELEISLEYTTPAYRDCSAGKYLYSELAKKGVKKLVFAEKAEKHESYLKDMGYKQVNGSYVKTL